jgi:acyl carrier protein
MPWEEIMPGDTTQNLEESLKLLMMERCGTPEEKFRPEATLQGDLALDSLDAVELAMALEDKYNIKGRRHGPHRTVAT